jgi:hypothetical protein
MKIYVTEPADGQKFKMSGQKLIKEIKERKRIKQDLANQGQ